MNLKQFLKPDWRKIAIFIILSILFLSFRHSISFGELIFSVRGLPLPIETSDFSWRYGHPRLILCLIIDLLFWYFISCLILYVYNKLKK
ncbi:MAG: hypothetical protein AUJ24_00690 [Parcubacteria group bacterium CG1_02_36_42]|uniref:Uncharacterized protein n=1 Tax=Candidatus Nealsonbacteria bacterium CG_4_9_14_0_8_um_filter_35_12 TaxID=1974692 RepID=A0A2M8DMB3_9BACT|nr:MAG: hypothetical protein AUJ24_00690 [Parcubacteria group bacterium CG1_02_36_42]PJB99281.1 MAG: hypothetical protein CO077_02610 [Candidatus Nealsonbacteria bacterium CG_4_9_14_0_8_um_filter_35_12]